MNIQNLSPLRKIALTAIVKVWVDDFNQRKKYQPIGSDENEQNNLQSLVWSVSETVFDIDELDVSWFLSEYRPDYKLLARQSESNSFKTFNLDRLSDDDNIMVYDMLDALFLCEVTSLMKELAEKVENGWHYHDILADMQEIAMDVF